MQKFIVRKFGQVTVAALFSVCLAVPAHAGTCYNPNPKRDKWLSGWVAWIPAKGQEIDLRGKSFNQKTAIAKAKRDIPDVFKKRGSNIKESAAGMSALEMIKAKNNEENAMRAYARLKLPVSWDNASACWK